VDLTQMHASPAQMKLFPPGRAGVLLPLADRRTAAGGVGLYTVSTPRKLRVQQAAHRWVQALGARSLPGRVEAWTPPVDEPTWLGLLHAWTQVIGAVDGIAVYQRRQPSRGGLTALLTARGRPSALVKVRTDGTALEREQRALAAIQQAQPTSFHAPAPLGLGRLADVSWSLQEALFTRPHWPVTAAPRGLFDEISAALVPVVGSSAEGTAPAHGDLTPWNLRRDHRGHAFLYDWEDVCVAPADADRAYFHATAAALGAAEMPVDLPEPALDFWRTRVQERPVENPQDATLATSILGALEAARPTG